jgi:outer membrane immunogenic protein
MRKLLLRSVAVAAVVSGPAYAADMPLKAPPPAPVYEWTGFYVDVGVGWSGSRLAWDYVNFPGEVPFNLSVTNGFLTGHIGYQQQFGWVVTGVEFGSGSNFTSNFGSAKSPGLIPGAACETGTAGEACQARISEMTTLGGKLGGAWNDWLFYGVGGGAWGGVQTQLVLPAGTLFDSNSQSRRGWYAGAGVDYMFAKTQLADVIFGVEYEHFNFGTGLLTSAADAFSPVGVNARTIAASEDAVFAKVTVKINPWR